MSQIPNARGLTEELSTRINECLVVGQPTEKMAPDGIHKLTRYEIFDGYKRLGVVQVNSWNYKGTTRIAHIVYDGVIPGYRNGRKIGMTATESSTLDLRDPEYFQPRDLAQPNNTSLNPLYRHDGHPLRLANYEVDGKQRVVLSEAEASKLEKELEKVDRYLGI